MAAAGAAALPVARVLAWVAVLPGVAVLVGERVLAAAAAVRGAAVLDRAAVLDVAMRRAEADPRRAGDRRPSDPGAVRASPEAGRPDPLPRAAAGPARVPMALARAAGRLPGLDLAARADAQTGAAVLRRADLRERAAVAPDVLAGGRSPAAARVTPGRPAVVPTAARAMMDAADPAGVSGATTTGRIGRQGGALPAAARARATGASRLARVQVLPGPVLRVLPLRVQVLPGPVLRVQIARVAAARVLARAAPAGRRQARRSIHGQPGPAARADPKVPGTAGPVLTGPPSHGAQDSRSRDSAAILARPQAGGPARRRTSAARQAAEGHRRTARLMRASGGRPIRAEARGLGHCLRVLEEARGPVDRLRVLAGDRVLGDRLRVPGEARVLADRLRVPADPHAPARSLVALPVRPAPGAQARIPVRPVRSGRAMPGLSGLTSPRLSRRTSWIPRPAMS
jgi:hypothetical protein